MFVCASVCVLCFHVCVFMCVCVCVCVWMTTFSARRTISLMFLLRWRWAREDFTEEEEREGCRNRGTCTGLALGKEWEEGPQLVVCECGGGRGAEWSGVYTVSGALLGTLSSVSLSQCKPVSVNVCVCVCVCIGREENHTRVTHVIRRLLGPNCVS